MAITFNCPCGKVLAARERDAGKKGVCPHCGRSWKVAGEVPRAAAPPRRAKASDVEKWLFAHTRSIWRGAALVGLLLVVGFMWYTGLGWDREPGPPPLVAQPDSPESMPADRPLPARIDPALDPTLGGRTPAASDRGLGPDAPPWATSFAAFVAAARSSEQDEQALETLFTGQEIRWTVTYNSVHGESALFFDEAVDLLVLQPPIQVWAYLAPSEIHKTANLREGQQVTLQGVMSHATSLRTQHFPDGVVRIGPKRCVIVATPAAQ